MRTINNIITVNNVSFILVFIEGLLSFLSPCVIPLIPIYMGYLSGSAKQIGEDGAITYKRKKVFLHTVFFVLGISFAFFLLGMTFTTLGSFFQNNRLIIARVGGILIILLGLVQIGFLEFNFLKKQRRFSFNFNKEMNPLIALAMGFTFSFAWTPCVGPALSSVLIMAYNANSQLVGNLLVLLYSIGFIIPFLLLGLFTTQALNFLKKHQKLLKYTIKLGGALLILIGFMTFTGWMNGITKYFSPISDSPDAPANNQQTDSNKVVAFDFTLKDQYGKEHTISDYKGKVVFLNFWATWCPPCKKEMPDIEEIYKEYGENSEDLIILGVANPSSENDPYNNEGSQEEVIAFLEDNEYTFPTVFDTTREIYGLYQISALPTTYIIGKDGTFYGYAAGMLTKDIMVNAIEQALQIGE